MSKRNDALVVAIRPEVLQVQVAADRHLGTRRPEAGRRPFLREPQSPRKKREPVAGDFPSGAPAAPAAASAPRRRGAPPTDKQEPISDVVTALIGPPRLGNREVARNRRRSPPDKLRRETPPRLTIKPQPPFAAPCNANVPISWTHAPPPFFPQHPLRSDPIRSEGPPDRPPLPPLLSALPFCYLCPGEHAAGRRGLYGPAQLPAGRDRPLPHVVVPPDLLRRNRPRRGEPRGRPDPGGPPRRGPRGPRRRLLARLPLARLVLPAHPRDLALGLLQRDPQARPQGRRQAPRLGVLLRRPPRPPRSRHEDPAAALHQHLQRLQQLGRLQPLRLQRPGQRAGPSRLLRRPPASQFKTWEQPFVAWAESNGFTLDYAVNSDLEFLPELLDPYKLVLSVGHDEYWSAPMRDHLEAFIAGGQRRLLQRQHLLLAGPFRRRRPGPRLLETGVRAGPGFRLERPPPLEHALEPPPRPATRKRAHGRRLPLRRLPPEPRPVHARPRILHRPPSRPLALGRHGPEAGRDLRRQGHDRRLRMRRLRIHAAATACPSRPTATARRRRS